MFTAGAIVDGRYEILGPLGSGGMGQVFRARRVRLGDEVALKAMHPTAFGPEAAERFLRESRACARLRHPHIVSILDYDVDAGGHPFLVMELLSGPSLREEIGLGGAFAPDRAIPVLAAVGGAVQLAHDHGITHRDLKPANIVAHDYGSGDRVYKVIDFGLAALAQPPDVTRLTVPFTFLGTLAYAAPEQLAGETVGPSADQYSVGVIAYELLTGRRPFDAADPWKLAQQVTSGTTTLPSQLRPALTSAADRTILRAMARRPDQRWPSVAAFIEALIKSLAVTTGAAVGTSSEGPSLLSRYDVGESLGPGRLGSLVRRGTHRALGVPVAIRHLKREGQPHWDAVRERFLREAQTLQVRHPNLLHVRDFGEDAAGVFVVTDLVAGPSLRDRLAAGPMSWPLARQLTLQMVDAATALHANGGLLTGVNPETIRVTGAGGDEQLVLSSGGIRALGDVLSTMREPQLRGQESSELELPFIAPEVLTGRAPDPRADVFTVAAIAVYLVTAGPPFEAPSLPELIGRMLQPGSPVPLPDVVPPAATSGLRRCLSADPAQRGTLADLRAAVT